MIAEYKSEARRALEYEGQEPNCSLRAWYFMFRDW